jgi:integration host factor subunit alpha
LPIADNCPKGRIPSRNVTRDDLAIAVGKATPALSRAAARDLVDQLFSEIETGLRTDRIVSLQGFGVFKIRSKAARVGRNPRSNSGAIYPIPAHEAVSFKASPILRRVVETSPDADLANAAE